jgi:hypothetical protein
METKKKKKKKNRKKSMKLGMLRMKQIAEHRWYPLCGEAGDVEDEADR